MKITAAQFKQEIANPSARTMNLIFIGMSGSGKSHWSKLIAQSKGYERVEFDELIGHSKRLGDLVKQYEGRDMAEKMGHYFGMPWTEGFDDREREFLKIENSFMSDFPESGAVLDTTGSFIYHPEALRKIADSGLVVYLETDAASRQKMFEIYLKHPKPVCWCGVYQPQDGETNEETLARCYPLLLETRGKLYEQYADVTLPFEVHKNAQTPEDLIKAITERLS